MVILLSATLLQLSVSLTKLQIALAASQPVAAVQQETHYVTAYSLKEGCNNKGCFMASGKAVYVGAAACPRAIPFGTQIEILGSIYTCEDRLAEKFDMRFDIFIPDYNEALKFGIQKTSVKIYE